MRTEQVGTGRTTIRLAAIWSSVPKLQYGENLNGSHGELPERQPEHWPRERSLEHRFLTPVFGTAQPPKGLSGVIRRFSYARYSEGRAAHWLLLLAADRVDTLESNVRSFATLRPDNPITETGVLSEFRAHGLKSRLGQKRADVMHQPLDAVIFAGPWLLAGSAVYKVLRRVRGGRRS